MSILLGNDYTVYKMLEYYKSKKDLFFQAFFRVVDSFHLQWSEIAVPLFVYI